MLEARSRKARHIQEEMTQWILVRAPSAKHGKTRTRTRTRPRTPSKYWDSGKRGQYSKDCWRRKDQTKKGGSKVKNKEKTITDAHNLDSTKPAHNEPEVEVGGFDMSYFSVAVRESDWIKFGVDGVKGQRGSRAPHTGSAFLAMCISRSAQPLWRVLSRSRANDCAFNFATIGESISSRCPSVCMQTTVVCR